MNEKLSITLPAEMVAVIQQQVEAGRYATTSEMLRDAIAAWMREEEEQASQMASIRARIARSLADPRPPVPIDEAFERLEAHIRRIAQ